MESYQKLGIALGIGLLIGLERGWRGRTLREGERVAGLRTFALIGFAGGLSALLSEDLGGWVVVAAFLGIAALETAAYYKMPGARNLGITTEVAAFVTFALGALAVLGHPAVAVAGAVVTAALLGFKPALHGWVARLERLELEATLKLLLISLVVLPILPDQGYGPWAALNPYDLWRMVVLIAGISYAGYFAMKLAGSNLGAGLTGLFGGLSSSTAVALSFARQDAAYPEGWRAHAAAVLIASATVFPRLLLVISAIYEPIVGRLTPAFLAAAVVTYGAGGALLWRAKGGAHASRDPELKNPLELVSALKFGVLLAGITLGAAALRHWLGDHGVYLSAGVAGIADVDAITLSLARLAGHGLSVETAAGGIALAVAVNTVVKAGLVAFIGGRRMTWAVGLTLLAALAAGGATAFLN